MIANDPSHSPQIEITPFLKWAGGKRWLAPRIQKMVEQLEGRYIEPFVGSGAIYFALAPHRALLSDVNESLIETYRCVRDSPHEVSKVLGRHDARHSSTYYYEVRKKVFTKPIERAASFIYLNRTCWNGLYRVNQKGKFNVPIGTKTSALLPTDDWGRVSEMLSGAQLCTQDFEKTIDAAKEGDLIFADPPYTVKHNLNGFIKYNESLFSWEDQIRLRDSLLRAKKRNVLIYATNADHHSVRELYAADFDLISLERASVLSGNPSYRGKFNELFIMANKGQGRSDACKSQMPGLAAEAS